MKHLTVTRSFILVFILFFITHFFAQAAIIASPDERITVTVDIGKNGQLYYSIALAGQELMQQSRLGVVRDDEDFSQGFSGLFVSPVLHVRDHYTMRHGKQQEFSYEANKRVFYVKNAGGKQMSIIFQVSNDGVAFCYVFPEDTVEVRKITSEVTAFNFASGTRAWIQPRAKARSGWEHSNPSYEEYYLQNTLLTDIESADDGWIYPALFGKGNSWVLISETWPQRNYCGSHLIKTGGNEFSVAFPAEVEGVPDQPVYPQATLPWQTPWRVLAIGSLKDIVESTLVTDVSPPSVLQDISYVKPGRASWSWVLLKDDSIVYDVQKRFVDYAANMGWEYCLVDVNWDTKIGYDKIKELATYANRKKVGLILWYNSAGSWNTTPYHPRNKLLTTEARQQEFARIREMGVKGVKVDFFGGDGQSMMTYYQQILDDAARAGLMVNFHGCTLPRGLQRTYPNLVSMEAVRGFEFVTFTQEGIDHQPGHCAMLPFTRNVFDPMDFTPVCFSEIPRLQRKTTNAFELALAILFHSGIQHYAEKPEGMKNVPDYVQQLMRTVPVSWEETQFVDGFPGKYVVMARKVKGKWYVAAINGEPTDKELSLKLPFINKKKGILITEGGDSRAFEKKGVNFGKGGTISLSLKGYGGFIIIAE